MTTKHQLSFNVIGDVQSAGRAAQGVIEEHCIVDHFATRSNGIGNPATVIIHFTAANENEAERISTDAVRAAQFLGGLTRGIDAVSLKHTPKRKGR